MCLKMTHNDQPSSIKQLKNKHHSRNKKIHEDTINILLIGQSGVGKSTLINSVYNYLKYDTLDEAEKHGVLTEIATSFSVTDDEYKTRTVSMSSNNTRKFTVGESRTVKCQTYDISFMGKTLRIIDTPGLGDSQGLEQDRKNVKKIMDYIKQLSKLHAICILVKPNESRLGVLFEFCVKEIIKQLHRTAAQNLIYCFTNSRNTFYKPGDTLPVLESILSSIGLEGSREKYFCLDNEAYRFLCSLGMENVSYSKEDRNSYSTSWVKSSKETIKMFEYIMELEPHNLAHTTKLTDCRKIVLELVNILTHISEEILSRINKIDSEEYNIEIFQNDIKKLEDSKLIRKTESEYKPLDEFCVLCLHCKKILDENGLKVTKQNVCHYDCMEGLKYGSVKHCMVFSRLLNSSCRTCGCKPYNHVYTNRMKVTHEFWADNIDAQIEVKRHQSLEKQSHASIKMQSDYKKQLEFEKDIILKNSVILRVYLTSHSLSQSHDVMRDHFVQLMESEKSKIKITGVNTKALNNYCQILEKYDSEVANLESEIDDNVHVIDEDDVHCCIEELKSLKMYGDVVQNRLSDIS